jgi:multiple sugar transport system substrate-binding protein
MPAKEEDRAAFFAGLDERAAPNDVDWAVAEEMLLYPDLPNHEAWLPNLAKARDILDKWRVYLTQTPGLDMDVEIEKLRADLDAAFKDVPPQ